MKASVRRSPITGDFLTPKHKRGERHVTIAFEPLPSVVEEEQKEPLKRLGGSEVFGPVKLFKM